MRIKLRLGSYKLPELTGTFVHAQLLKSDVLLTHECQLLSGNLPAKIRSAEIDLTTVLQISLGLNSCTATEILKTLSYTCRYIVTSYPTH